MQETEAKPIRILGISGSPRNMATDFLVREALKIAEEKYGTETDYFSSKGKKLNFCIHCDFCIRTKEGCIHKDDISAELYDKMIWADAWIECSNQNNNGQMQSRSCQRPKGFFE